MADNKKYYYLKLKDNFFDSEEMIILQNMPDGYLYSDILMKLYLRSLKNEGKLIFKEFIPYTPSALAQVVRHQVGTVEKALKIFRDIGLIDVLDNGAIYMLDIQNFIGQSSTESDRIRDYRKRISSENSLVTNVTSNVREKHNIITPEIEIELNKELKIKKNKEKKNKDMIPPTLLEVQAHIKEKGYSVNAEKFFNYFDVGNWIDSNGNKVKNWKQKLITWESRNTVAEVPIKKVENKISLSEMIRIQDEESRAHKLESERGATNE